MPDQNKRINSERELDQDQNGNTHTRVTPNTETVRNNLPDDYRDGYTHGRIAQGRDRDRGKATRGLLLGLILTSVLGIAGGLLYYLSQKNNEPTTVPVTVPAPSPTATLSPSPTPERTIIERERTIQTSPTFVPIPQPPATTSPTPEPTINIQPSPTASPSPLNVNPEVNINIPPSATPTPETPSGQTAPTPTITPDTNAVPGVSGSQSQSQTPTPSPIPTPEAPSLPTAPTAPANQSDVAPQASPDATGSSPSPGAANP
jgi:cytoskeletal protein RodZ